jgi:hypothetical protein
VSSYVIVNCHLNKEIMRASCENLGLVLRESIVGFDVNYQPSIVAYAH